MNNWLWWWQACQTTSRHKQNHTVHTHHMKWNKIIAVKSIWTISLHHPKLHVLMLLFPLHWVIFVRKQAWIWDFWSLDWSPKFVEAHSFQRRWRICSGHKIMTLIDLHLQKIFTFRRPQNNFYYPQTNFSTFCDFISKSSKINLKSTDHSGIRTQNTIACKLSAYHLAVRCFFPLENLITNRKVTDINLKRSIIEKIQEKRKWSQQQHSPLKHEKTPLWHNSAQQPQHLSNFS